MISRIINWNKARYPQKFVKNLQMQLLVEEVEEFIYANKEIDELDALIDIVYVAIGAMWKLGLSAGEITKAIHIVCDSNDSKVVVQTAPHIKANIAKGPEFIPPEPRLQEILDGLAKKSA